MGMYRALLESDFNTFQRKGQLSDWAIGAWTGAFQGQLEKLQNDPELGEFANLLLAADAGDPQAMAVLTGNASVSDVNLNSAEVSGSNPGNSVGTPEEDLMTWDEFSNWFNYPQAEHGAVIPGSAGGVTWDDYFEVYRNADFWERRELNARNIWNLVGSDEAFDEYFAGVKEEILGRVEAEQAAEELEEAGITDEQITTFRQRVVDAQNGNRIALDALLNDPIFQKLDNEEITYEALNAQFGAENPLPQLDADLLNLADKLASMEGIPPKIQNSIDDLIRMAAGGSAIDEDALLDLAMWAAPGLNGEDLDLIIDKVHPNSIALEEGDHEFSKTFDFLKEMVESPQWADGAFSQTHDALREAALLDQDSTMVYQQGQSMMDLAMAVLGSTTNVGRANEFADVMSTYVNEAEELNKELHEHVRVDIEDRKKRALEVALEALGIHKPESPFGSMAVNTVIAALTDPNHPLYNNGLAQMARNLITSFFPDMANALGIDGTALSAEEAAAAHGALYDFAYSVENVDDLEAAQARLEEVETTIRRLEDSASYIPDMDQYEALNAEREVLMEAIAQYEDAQQLAQEEALNSYIELQKQEYIEQRTEVFENQISALDAEINVLVNHNYVVTNSTTYQELANERGRLVAQYEAFQDDPTQYAFDEQVADLEKQIARLQNAGAPQMVIDDLSDQLDELQYIQRLEAQISDPTVPDAGYAGYVEEEYNEQYAQWERERFGADFELAVDTLDAAGVVAEEGIGEAEEAELAATDTMSLEVADVEGNEPDSPNYAEGGADYQASVAIENANGTGRPA